MPPQQPQAPGDWFDQHAPRPVTHPTAYPIPAGGGVPVQYSQVPDDKMPAVAAGMLAAGAGPAALEAGAGAASAWSAANPGVAAATGKALAGGMALTAARKMGVSPDVLTGLVVLAGMKGMIPGFKGGAETAPTEAAPEEASPNAGGKLVPAEEPTLNDVIGKALDNLQKKAPPAKMTTPPQPELPAGYTPRTTVPKPAAPRPYFLKPETVDDPTSAIQPQAATGPRATPQSVDYMQLPPSWQRNTLPASFAPKEIEGSGLAAAFREELVRRGISPGDAIPLVLQNKDLPVAVKTQLVSALEKVARYQPQ